MHDTLTEAIERRALPLPVLSHIAQQAMSAMSDDNYDPGKLADLIHKDQTFAAHLIRLANSPMYRARARIVSLRQAIMQLGIRTVSELTFFIACRASTFKVGELQSEVEGTFPHAFACAQYAQAVAKASGLNSEELFLAGLLHDLGRPVLYQAAVSHHVKHSPGTPIDRIGLIKTVDALHAKASAALAESWHLPERIVVAVRDHHTPDSSASYDRYAHAVSLADVLAHAALDAGYDPKRAREHASIAHLGLTQEKVEALIELSESVKNAARALNG